MNTIMRVGQRWSFVQRRNQVGADVPHVRMLFFSFRLPLLQWKIWPRSTEHEQKEKDDHLKRAHITSCTRSGRHVRRQPWMPARRAAKDIDIYNDLPDQHWPTASRNRTDSDRSIRSSAHVHHHVPKRLKSRQKDADKKPTTKTKTDDRRQRQDQKRHVDDTEHVLFVRHQRPGQAMSADGRFHSCTAAGLAQLIDDRKMYSKKIPNDLSHKIGGRHSMYKKMQKVKVTRFQVYRHVPKRSRPSRKMKNWP